MFGFGLVRMWCLCGQIGCLTLNIAAPDAECADFNGCARRIACWTGNLALWEATPVAEQNRMEPGAMPTLAWACIKS